MPFIGRCNANHLFTKTYATPANRTDSPSSDRPMTEVRRSLRDRARSGALWIMFAHGGAIALRLVVSLALAHWLNPSMLGVMALAQTLLGGLSMFSDLGLRPYLVQSERGEDPEVLNTLWTLQVARGALVSVCTILIGVALMLGQQWAWVAQPSAYADPRLPWVFFLLSIVPAIGGFESTRTAQCQRRLDMGRLTQIGLLNHLINAIVMLALVYWSRSLWALPLAGIEGILVYTLLTHWRLPGTANQFSWNRSLLPEIRQFSRWILLSSMVGFFANNLDRLILGGFASAGDLGIYSIAASAIMLLSDGLARLLGDLGLPLFSEVYRERPGEMRAAHYKFRKPFDVVCCLAAGGIAASGSSIVGLIYDSRYAAAGPMLELLAWSLIAFRYRVTTQALLAMGDSRNQFHQSLATALAVASCGYAGARLGGLTGFVLGVSLSGLLSSSVTLIRAGQCELLSWWNELRFLPLVGVGYALGLLGAHLLDVLHHLLWLQGIR